MPFWTFDGWLSGRTIRLCFWIVTLFFLWQFATQATGVWLSLKSLQQGVPLTTVLTSVVGSFFWPVIFIVFLRLGCEGVIALQAAARAAERS